MARLRDTHRDGRCYGGWVALVAIASGEMAPSGNNAVRSRRGAGAGTGTTRMRFGGTEPGAWFVHGGTWVANRDALSGQLCVRGCKK